MMNKLNVEAVTLERLTSIFGLFGRVDKVIIDFQGQFALIEFER